MTSAAPLLITFWQSLGSWVFVFAIMSAITREDLGRNLFNAIFLSLPLVVYFAIKNLDGAVVILIYTLLFWLFMQVLFICFLYVRRRIRYRGFVNKFAGDDAEVDLSAYGKPSGFAITFNTYILDLLPVVELEFGVSANELPKIELQVVEPSHDNPFPDATVDCTGTITVNTAMASFIWHLSKIVSTRVVGKEAGQTTSFTFEQSLEYLRTLLNMYFDTHSQSASIEQQILPAFQLNDDQMAFAGWLLSTIERFIVAHELGHLLVDGGYKSTGKGSLPSREFVNNAYLMYGDGKNATDSQEDRMNDWYLELSADMIGMHLCIHTELEDEEVAQNLTFINRVYTQLSVPMFFRYMQLIEVFYEKKYGRSYVHGAHPPAIVRYESMRKIAISNEIIPGGLSVGESFEIVDQFFDRILREI